MKTNVSKRTARIEKKKKKMAALLAIVTLNENDRKKNAQQAKNNQGVTESNRTSSPDSEPSPKRQRTGDSSLEASIIISSANDEESREQSDLLTKQQELLELKKMLREKCAKNNKVQPSIRLREAGEKARLSVDHENRQPLFLRDIQHLLLFSQLGPSAPYLPARWCSLEKYSKLNSTIVLVIENMSLYHYTNHESMFTFLRTNFNIKLEIIAPATHKSNIVQELSMVPITGKTPVPKNEIYSREILEMVKYLFPIDCDNTYMPSSGDAPCLPVTDKFPRTQLLLSGWQLIEENFPLPIKSLHERKYLEYVCTSDRYKLVSPSSPMFGIDCEMCLTSSGKLELTRVSVVDENHDTFYDTLVKPKNKIVNYLTQYSGITAKMMKNVTKSLEEVQSDLRKILPSDAILVGQSLGTDLHALKMMHPYNIDTSVIFNTSGIRARKSKLQFLARDFLSMNIQQNPKGHCSTEDSLASLKLTQLKLSKSYRFGDAVMKNATEALRGCDANLGIVDYNSSMLKQTSRDGSKTLVVTHGETESNYKYFIDKNCDDSGDKVTSEKSNYENHVTFLTEKSNGDVVKKLCEFNDRFSLSIGHVKVGDQKLGSGDGSIFTCVDNWVKDIYEHSFAPGLLCIIFGGSTNESGSGCCFLTIKRA